MIILRLKCIQINQHITWVTCLKPTHLGTYPKTTTGLDREPSIKVYRQADSKDGLDLSVMQHPLGYPFFVVNNYL